MRVLRTQFSTTGNIKIVSLLLVWIIIIFITLHNFATTTEIRSRTTSYQFYKHRIRLWNEGRCIDSPDGKRLEVYFCDPDVEQAFSLDSDHKLIYERTGGCVGYSKSEEGYFTNQPLHLQECDASEGIGYFDLINGSYIMVRPLKNSHSESAPHFITPLLRDDSQLVKLQKHQKYVCINGAVGLTKFDKERSRVILSEESFFQEDRKLLKNAPIIARSDDSCDFKACGFNKRISPIEKLPADQIQRCTKPWECVTLVVKTARRPHLVTRLAQSVRDSYGYDLPIACYDDGPDDYPQDIRDRLAQYPLLTYVVSDDEDLGIAEGRNQALKMVDTKYFFLLDDDMMFMNTTDMQTMIDILDMTDATLVGGQLYHFRNWAALLKFGYFGGTLRRLGYFPGTCAKLNQTVPNFPRCFRCELNSNIWMAKTEPILQIGGWDPELKVYEHKDIFIKMKAAGYKLVTCKGIILKHAQPKKGSSDQVEGYYQKRHRGLQRYYSMTSGRYNIHDIFDYHGADVNEDGDPVLVNGPPPSDYVC